MIAVQLRHVNHRVYTRALWKERIPVGGNGFWYSMEAENLSGKKGSQDKSGELGRKADQMHGLAETITNNPHHSVHKKKEGE